jgi:hypothetical protein
MAVVALAAVLLAGVLWSARWWRSEGAAYIRPLADMDEAVRDTFESAGVKQFAGFEYSIPRDHKAVVTIIARDKNGVIDSLSKVTAVVDHQPGPKRVRLLRIDPDELRENKSGRVRWLLKIGSWKGLDAWTDRREPAAGFASMLSHVDPVEGLEPGNTYSVWDYKVIPLGVDFNNPSFALELRFKFEPRGSTPTNSIAAFPYREEPEKGEARSASESETRTP